MPVPFCVELAKGKETVTPQYDSPLSLPCETILSNIQLPHSVTLFKGISLPGLLWKYTLNGFGTGCVK